MVSKSGSNVKVAYEMYFGNIVRTAASSSNGMRSSLFILMCDCVLAALLFIPVLLTILNYNFDSPGDHHGSLPGTLAVERIYRAASQTDQIVKQAPPKLWRWRASAHITARRLLYVAAKVFTLYHLKCEYSRQQGCYFSLSGCEEVHTWFASHALLLSM